MQIRTDCEYFEPKQHKLDCGDCQTDGHFLCAGCKNIAPFEEMELSDNRMHYYDKQEKEKKKNERITELLSIKAELLNDYGLFGGGDKVNKMHEKINQELESLGIEVKF